jgi:hypothetical protein
VELQHSVRSLRVLLGWNNYMSMLYRAYELTSGVLESGGQEEGQGWETTEL